MGYDKVIAVICLLFCTSNIPLSLCSTTAVAIVDYNYEDYLEVTSETPVDPDATTIETLDVDLEEIGLKTITLYELLDICLIARGRLAMHITEPNPTVRECGVGGTFTMRIRKEPFDLSVNITECITELGIGCKLLNTTVITHYMSNVTRTEDIETGIEAVDLMQFVIVGLLMVLMLLIAVYMWIVSPYGQRRKIKQELKQAPSGCVI